MSPVNQARSVETLQSLFRIPRMGKAAMFIWVPLHLGVCEKERDDKYAKDATKVDQTDVNRHQLSRKQKFNEEKE